jgi:hypothetical protein
MNKIVKEHYPAAKLPEDLREGLDPAQNVTVTIATEDATPEKPLSLKELFAMRRPPYRSLEEIMDDLRRQRDEWDD